MLFSNLLAVGYVHANKGEALPGVKPNMSTPSLCGLTHRRGQKWNFPSSSVKNHECMWFDSSFGSNISLTKQQQVVAASVRNCRALLRKKETTSRLCLCPPNPSTLLYSSLSITRIPNGYECFSARFSQSCVLTIVSCCKWHLQGRGWPSSLRRGHASKSISPEMRFTE